MSSALKRSSLLAIALSPVLPRVQAANQAAAPSALPARPPVYDVATIRLNTSGSGNSKLSVSETTLQTENFALRGLLQMAFDVRRAQIIGMPAWAEKARFDITAKRTDVSPAANTKISLVEQRLAFRRLIGDRFGLKWHTEDRVLPTYELRLAKGGAKFKPGTHCGPEDDSTRENDTDLSATCVRMRDLANLLSNEMDRPIVDKTGLAGRYNFHLRWSSDEARIGSSDNGSEADTPPPLFTALEEQLGLRLTAAKDPVPSLVIDQISRPTEN